MSKSFSKSLLAAALFGCVLIAAAGTPAHALARSESPGSFCVRVAGPETDEIRWGALTNASPTSSISVDCPIEKKTITTGVNFSGVTVVDQHPTLNVSCSLCYVQRTSTGVLPTCTSLRSSTGAAIGEQYLAFGLSRTFIEGQVHRNWYFSCSIPPAFNGARSEVFNYYVNEQ